MRTKLPILLTSLGALFFASTLSAQKVLIDLDQSSIEWSGKKAVIASEHVGNVKIKSGYIDFKEQKPQTGEVVVDMTSITNKDLEDPEWNQKLVGHLKGEDFFAVDQHPTSTLTLTSFTQKEPNTFEIMGTLTIKGISKPTQIKAQAVTAAEGIKQIEASFEFDRTEFEVRYGSGKFFSQLGDKMISDTVRVKATIKLMQPIKLGLK